MPTNQSKIKKNNKKIGRRHQILELCKSVNYFPSIVSSKSDILVPLAVWGMLGSQKIVKTMNLL